MRSKMAGKIYFFILVCLNCCIIQVFSVSLLLAAEPDSAPAASGPGAVTAESNDGTAVDSSGEELDPVVIDIIEEFGLWEDEEAVSRIENIADRLIQAAGEISDDKKIIFIPLDEDSINAFAMAEGRIFIFRGLVERAETDDQLASVMAHEMTHVIHNHHSKGQDAMVAIQLAGLLGALAAGEQEPVIAGQMISAALIESYGRDSEVDADLSGVDLMIRAGYDPLGMIEFFTYMEGQQRRRPQLEGNYFTIHPYAEERLDNLEQYLAAKGIDVPDNLYRLHLALDLDCREVDGHFECTIFIGDKPTFFLAGDDEETLTNRGFEVIHRLRDEFTRGLRDYQVYKRHRDGTYFIGARGSVLISVTANDEKYLTRDAESINSERLENLKFILWEYYIKWSI